MTIDISSLSAAISALANAVAESTLLDADAATTPRLRDVVHAGVIQSFEFSYELAWKTLRRALIAQQGASALTGVDKAELFRVAARQGWLNSPQKWLDYNAARNMTSHAYDHVIAEDIYAIAVEFLSEVRILENHLRERGNNDGT